MFDLETLYLSQKRCLDKMVCKSSGTISQDDQDLANG